MNRIMLGGKIHRATVTEACLDYEGSITIDSRLLELAGIIPNEAVEVWNVTNGSRLTTYAIPAPPDSGVICINGAAAHHMKVGDTVIIASFISLDEKEAEKWTPHIVFVDEKNRPLEKRPEKTQFSIPSQSRTCVSATAKQPD